MYGAASTTGAALATAAPAPLRAADRRQREGAERHRGPDGQTTQCLRRIALTCRFRGAIGIVFDLLHVLRIHRLGAAARRLHRQAVLLGELGQIRVLADQVVRHVGGIASRHFVVGLAEQPRLVLIGWR